MTSQAAPPELAILDSNLFRRASIASLLNDWASEHGLVVAQVAPEEILRTFDGNRSWRLVVISIGSEPIEAASIQVLLRSLRVLAAKVPSVVLSDREDPVEILAAYNASCIGYLPTNMEPRLVLQALSFILHGGTFFPPSVMQLLRPTTDAGSPPDPQKRPPPTDPGSGPLGSPSKMSAYPPSATPKLQAPGAKAADEVEIACDAGSSCDGGMTGTETDEEEDQGNGLTRRQVEVLAHLRHGSPNKVIARELGVTEGTVKVHVRQIMRRLGAANRTQAAVLSEREHHSDGQIPVQLTAGEFQIGHKERRAAFLNVRGSA